MASFSRWREARAQGSQDLNLIPVMNLFMVLIPFLLMGAAFYHISVIPASVPVNDPQQSDVPKTPTTVAVNLEIKPEALSLTAASVSLSEEELDALGAVWPRGDQGYDAIALQAHLKGLKAKYPSSNTITILPHDKLDYEELVVLLDHARERATGELNAKGEPAFEELFPVTIFSRLLVLPPQTEEELDEAGEQPSGDDTEGLSFGDEAFEDPEEGN